MSMLDFHIRLFAQYNQAMNQKVYASIAGLSAAELTQSRGAYFDSILGTLNHLLVGDIIWFRRFAQHPAGFASLQALEGQPKPQGLDAILFDDLASLANARA